MSSSSSSVDLQLFEATSRESATSSRIGAYNDLIQSALSSISSRESSLQLAPLPSTVEDFITRYTTGLDLDYSDDANSSLSNLRVAERLRELSGLEQIVATNSQGVQALADTRIAVSRTDLTDQVTRIRDIATAEESAQSLRRSLLGSFEQKFGALGALQPTRVSALIAEMKTPDAPSGSSLSADTQTKKGTSFKV